MLDRKFLALTLVVVFSFKIIFFFQQRYYFARSLGFLLTRLYLVMSVKPGC